MFPYISECCQKLGTSKTDLISAMMLWKAALVVLLAGVASAARLDYLPPSGGVKGSYGAPGGYGTRIGAYNRVGVSGAYSGAGGYRGAGAYRAGGAGYAGAAGYGGAGSGVAYGAGGQGYNGAAGYTGATGYGGAYGGAGRFGVGGVSGPFIPIVAYENNPNLGDGSYSWSYVTANDIRAQEEGYLNLNAPEGPGEAARGSFSFVAPDGQQFAITYTADENGFVPQGTHLPTPPPIPPEILESLQKNAADEAAGIYDDGSYREEGVAYTGAGGARIYGGAAKYGGATNYAAGGAAYGVGGAAYGVGGAAYGAGGAAYNAGGASYAAGGYGGKVATAGTGGGKSY